MQLVARDADWSGAAPAATLRSFHVVIVGAGFSGLCAATKLDRLGINWSLFEKNEDLGGGTWFENAYPHAGVDTPNHFYSYSFAPNSRWSGYFSKRDELWGYSRRVADQFGVTPRIDFAASVESMIWSDTAQLWDVTVRTNDGALRTVHANAVITATGQLNRPKIPAVPGLPDFVGPCFHTAQRRHDIPLTGRRVAVVGTGASAKQLLAKVAAEAAQVTVFQSSPQWVRPSQDYHRGVTAEMVWVAGDRAVLCQLVPLRAVVAIR